MVLIVSLLVGGFALLSSALVLDSPLTESGRLGLFVLTLVVLAPAAIAGGRLLARKVDAGGGRGALAELAALTATGTLGVLVAARGSYALGHRSSTVMLALGLMWALCLAWAVAWLTRGRRLLPTRLRGTLGDPRGVPAWVAIAGLAWVAMLAFFPPRFFHPDQLAVSLLLTAALLFLHLKWRPTSMRWVGLLLDVVVVVLVVMMVTDVSGYQEYLRTDAHTFVISNGIRFTPGLLSYAQRIHEGFFLAPLNDVLHGRAMLVGTSSQYGVGVFYFLAAFFQIAPLGYGALGLLSGFLTALQFALAYGVLRLAGVARILAISAAVAAVLGLVMGALGSYNDFPSTGGLRYGIPWLIIAVALLAARRPDRRLAAWAVAIVLVACASVWSFETFAYAGATYTAAVTFEAATGERGRRLRMLVAYLAAAFAACAVAHMILATATRLFAGAWPDWSTYLAYLNAYGAKDSLSAAPMPWALGLPLLLVHLTSLVSLGALVARDHEILRARRPSLIAITATSGLGIASYTYWVGLWLPGSLLVVGLPALVVVALWLSLAADASARVPNALRLTALALAMWLAATLAISGWSYTEIKWRRTALAHVIPATGEDSLPAAASRLWHNPRSDPRALEAQQLLDRHLPHGAPALVIMASELTVETLVRSHRVDILPISHPVQDSLVPEQVNPKVIATIRALRPGTLLLTQPAAWSAAIKSASDFIANGLAPVQRLALDRIRARFRLQAIDRAPGGLAIMQLRPRSP